MMLVRPRYSLRWLLAVAAFGGWWERPRWTAQRFIDRLQQGETKQARAMMTNALSTLSLAWLWRGQFKEPFVVDVKSPTLGEWLRRERSFSIVFVERSGLHKVESTFMATPAGVMSLGAEVYPKAAPGIFSSLPISGWN